MTGHYPKSNKMRWRNAATGSDAGAWFQSGRARWVGDFRLIAPGRCLTWMLGGVRYLRVRGFPVSLLFFRHLPFWFRLRICPFLGPVSTMGPCVSFGEGMSDSPLWLMYYIVRCKSVRGAGVGCPRSHVSAVFSRRPKRPCTTRSQRGQRGLLLLLPQGRRRLHRRPLLSSVRPLR